MHKSLAKKFPAARSRTVATGIKVSFLVSTVANSPKNINIHPERTSELKTLRIGPWIKDRILLIDLGFYKHQVFAKDQREWRVLRIQVEGKCGSSYCGCA